MRCLILGGMTERFHEFWINGPAIRQAVTAKGGEGFLTEDLSVLTSPELGNYDVIVNYTTGRNLTDDEAEGLLRFVRGGHGLVGLHCGADTFRSHPAYRALLGGSFVHHPPQLDIEVEYVREHPILNGVAPFTVHDELYLLDWDPDRVQVLAVTHSYEGGEIPVLWVREEGQGRVVYCSLGHNLATLHHTAIETVIAQAVEWAGEQARVSESAQARGRG